MRSPNTRYVALAYDSFLIRKNIIGVAMSAMALDIKKIVRAKPGRASTVAMTLKNMPIQMEKNN